MRKRRLVGRRFLSVVGRGEIARWADSQSAVREPAPEKNYSPSHHAVSQGVELDVT
jgi:hypothetical protein